MPAKPSRFAAFDAAFDAETRERTTCKLCHFLATADEPDREYVASMLANPAKASAHIARVLDAGEVEISETSVKRHRAKHLAD